MTGTLRAAEKRGGIEEVVIMLRGTAKAREAASVFRALADPTRIKIVRLLAVGGEMFQKKLVLEVGKDQPAVSRHLTYLKRVHLVLERRVGRFVYVRLGPLPEAARELMRFFRDAAEVVGGLAREETACA